MNREITMYGFNYASIAYCEAKGLAKCFDAYAEHVGSESIQEIGFNANSGYVYISLDNGIQICSAFANDVEYLVSDYMNGEEYFCSSYDDAKLYIENQNQETE